MPGVKARTEIGAAICTLHVARDWHKGRHMIVFKPLTTPDSKVINVLRILHDRMDLERHLPSKDWRS